MFSVASVDVDLHQLELRHDDLRIRGGRSPSSIDRVGRRARAAGAGDRDRQAREWPDAVLDAASITAIDPDKRIVPMLGARSRGKTVAKASATETEIKQPT